MALTHNLGFPRIGARRELKQALEAYWRGDINDEQLKTTAAEIRKQHWLLQRETGIDLIPAGDFALYDQMLNMTALLGAVPARFNAPGSNEIGLDLYFAMARGTADSTGDGNDQVVRHQLSLYCPGIRCTDHIPYRFPATLQGSGRGPGSRHFTESGADRAANLFISWQGNHPRTSIAWTCCLICCRFIATFLPSLLPWAWNGCKSTSHCWRLIWMTSGCVAWIRPTPLGHLATLQGAESSSRKLPKLLLATYFEAVDNHAARLKKLPVDGLHIDLCRAPGQLDTFLEGYPADKVLSLGIIDGRNVWRADLAPAFSILSRAHVLLGERLWVAPSCSPSALPGRSRAGNPPG